jgi:hypothetical protein
MRGMVFTISIVLISMLIVSLSSFELENEREINRERVLQEGIGSAGYVFDDAADDLGDLTGVGIECERNLTHFSVTVDDGFPFPSSNLSSYESYMEEVYSGNTHSDISIDTSGMENRTVEFTNGIYYGREEGEWGRGTLSSPKEMNRTEIRANVVCSGPSMNITQMEEDAGGELHVVINYSDSSSSFLQDIYVNKGVDRWIEADFAAKKLRFVVNQTDVDYDRAYVEGYGDPSCSYELKVVFKNEYGGDIVYYYNTLLNYTQGNVTKNGYVEAGRV